MAENKMLPPRIPPELIRRARDLRREMTFPEQKLWSRLSGRQFLGLKFRKQHPITPFIADFYCAELKLVIEVDGASHEDAEYDAWRTTVMEKKGLTVFRVTNDDIVEDVDDVVERFAQFVKSKWDVSTCKERTLPRPSLRGRGEE